MLTKALHSFLACLMVLGSTLPICGKTRHHAKPKSLAQQVQAILSDPMVARAHWGISVVRLDGTPVYALNDKQYFQPASNAKLFTTAAALALLGPDFRLNTYVVAEGPVDPAGHLHGSLRLIGGGDPSLSGRTYPYSSHTEFSPDALQPLEELASQVAEKGIRALDGTLVADDSLFVYERYGQGWGQDDLMWDYGAPVSALAFNDNARLLTVRPGVRAGDEVIPAWDPALPDDSTLLKNEAVTAPMGPQPHLGLDRQVDQRLLRIYGSLPEGSKQQEYGIAVQDPARFAGQAFVQALEAKGIPTSGLVQVAHRLSGDTTDFTAETHQPLTLRPWTDKQLPFSPPAGAQIVAQRSSPPLGQLVTVVNKVSQNLHAEMLLRILGKAEGDDGSIAQGARVVRQFLISAGVSPEDFFFVDGSGLSPQDVITPRAATTLLLYAAHQPWSDVYRSSLPVGGVDGTLANRFQTSPLKGRIFAKTGTLAEVRSLSGYLIAASGRTLVFSILCNQHSPGTDTTREAMDRIAEAIAAGN